MIRYLNHKDTNLIALDHLITKVLKRIYEEQLLSAV